MSNIPALSNISVTCHDRPPALLISSLLLIPAYTDLYIPTVCLLLAVKPSSLAGRATPSGVAWTTAFDDPEDSGPGKALAAAPLDRGIATARQHWTLHSAPTHYINVPLTGRGRGLTLRCLLDALSIIGTVLVSLDALDFGTLAILSFGTLHPTDAIHNRDLLHGSKPVTYRADYI